MEDEKLFYSISEAAALVGVEEYVIRFWEKNFPLVKPARKAGRRYFRKRDIDVLMRIKDLLYRQGFTIKGAKKAMTDKKSAHGVEADEDDIPMMKPPAPAFERPSPVAVAKPAASAGDGSPPPKRQRVLARFSTSLDDETLPSAAPKVVVPVPSTPIDLNHIVKKIEAIEDMLK